VNKILRSFGANVRTERERIGISQEELAFRCGLHRTYVGSVERGERNLGLINVVRIAKALKVEPGRLMRSIGHVENASE